LILERIATAINRTVEYICFGMLAAMVAIVGLQVFYRYVLSSSLSWSEEIARYLFVWTVLLGGTSGVRLGFLVAVTFVQNQMPTALRKAVLIGINLLILAFAYVLVVHGFDLAQTVHRQLAPATRIPMSYVYGAIPVSGVLIVFYTLLHLWNLIRHGPPALTRDVPQ
jgi:TRAP-type transport system small permease protein